MKTNELPARTSARVLFFRVCVHTSPFTGSKLHVTAPTMLFAFAALLPPPRVARRAPAPTAVLDLLENAASGDAAAAIEAAALLVAGAGERAMRILWSKTIALTANCWPPPSFQDPGPTPVVVDIDLGADGEPAGVSRISFKPLLPRSDFILLELRVPLGLLIEESDDARIVVTDALPGYSAMKQVEKGDLVRAVTAYAQVAGSAPMWQQVTSGTPLGDVSLKRLLFRTDDATYTDVRNAIASHRGSEGGNDMVTLVLERAVESGTPLADRGAPLERESLAAVIARDIQQAPAKAIGDDDATAAERAESCWDDPA